MSAHIPWRHQQEWNQILPFFHASCRNNAGVRKAAKIAMEIAGKIAAVDDCLQELCRQTCPSCQENCCARANIWYDFRDLLFLFLLNEEWPGGQIVKKENHGCMHLTAKGCRLERLGRPFVCTWYICPAQKAKRRMLPYAEYGGFYSLLQEAQSDRKEMETVFISGLY